MRVDRFGSIASDAVRGLADGELADVRTKIACVRVPVRLHDALMPGTVALPHGWGHQIAPGLGIASRTRGVNVNLLAADGPAELDAVSGMSRLTGLVVDVSAAAGAQAPTWSGMDSDLTGSALNTVGGGTPSG